MDSQLRAFATMILIVKPKIHRKVVSLKSLRQFIRLSYRLRTSLVYLSPISKCYNSITVKRAIQFLAILFSVFSLFGIFGTKQVLAADTCSPIYPSVVEERTVANMTFAIPNELRASTVVVCRSNSDKNCVQIRSCNEDFGGVGGCVSNSNEAISNQSINYTDYTITAQKQIDVDTVFWLEWRRDNPNVQSRVCTNPNQWVITTSVVAPSCGSGTLAVTNEKGESPKSGDNLKITFNNQNTAGFFSQNTGGTIFLKLVNDSTGQIASTFEGFTPNDTSGKVSINGQGQSTINVGKIPDGSWKLVFTTSSQKFGDLCTTRFALGDAAPVGSGAPANFALCAQANPADIRECNKCVCGSDSSDKNACIGKEAKSLWTGIGCVPTTLTGSGGLIATLLRLGLSLSGGVATLAILWGAFNLTTSAGDTKKVNEAQEIISAAVMGILFVIFSVIILRFFGVSILQLPGFS